MKIYRFPLFLKNGLDEETEVDEQPGPEDGDLCHKVQLESSNYIITQGTILAAILVWKMVESIYSAGLQRTQTWEQWIHQRVNGAIQRNLDRPEKWSSRNLEVQQGVHRPEVEQPQALVHTGPGGQVNMSQIGALATKKALLSIGEATPVSNIEFPNTNCNRDAEKSPKKGHKDGEGTGTSLL